MDACNSTLKAVGDYFNPLQNFQRHEYKKGAGKILTYILVIPPIAMGVLGACVGAVILVNNLAGRVRSWSSSTATEVGNNNNTSSAPRSPESLGYPECPEKYVTCYELAPKAFTQKIMADDGYSLAEKSKLFEKAEIFAETAPDDWVKTPVTMAYLRWLAFQHPEFSPIPNTRSQFHSHCFQKEKNMILTSLPDNINDGPRIYGHPLQINENHRTSFIIDMNRCTVEYFNSFGCDAIASAPLQELTNGLSIKYGVKFHYKHCTEGKLLQQDGYQCGIWACKLIEDRVKRKQEFCTESPENFNIAKYRKHVFKKAYEADVYEAIGSLRKDKWLASEQITDIDYKNDVTNEASPHLVLWGTQAEISQEQKEEVIQKANQKRNKREELRSERKRKALEALALPNN